MTRKDGLGRGGLVVGKRTPAMAFRMGWERSSGIVMEPLRRRTQRSRERQNSMRSEGSSTMFLELVDGGLWAVDTGLVSSGCASVVAVCETQVKGGTERSVRVCCGGFVIADSGARVGARRLLQDRSGGWRGRARRQPLGQICGSRMPASAMSFVILRWAVARSRGFRQDRRRGLCRRPWCGLLAGTRE